MRVVGGIETNAAHCHRLDESIRLSLSLVASPQSLLLFDLTRSLSTPPSRCLRTNPSDFVWPTCARGRLVTVVGEPPPACDRARRESVRDGPPSSPLA